jgi:hypothetical protein
MVTLYPNEQTRRTISQSIINRDGKRIAWTFSGFVLVWDGTQVSDVGKAWATGDLSTFADYLVIGAPTGFAAASGGLGQAQPQVSTDYSDSAVAASLINPRFSVQ